LKECDGTGAFDAVIDALGIGVEQSRRVQKNLNREGSEGRRGKRW
jgi:hypothetical protein